MTIYIVHRWYVDGLKFHSFHTILPCTTQEIAEREAEKMTQPIQFTRGGRGRQRQEMIPWEQYIIEGHQGMYHSAATMFVYIEELEVVNQ